MLNDSAWILPRAVVGGRPRPAQLAPEFPTGFVGVLDRG
jgi:hypothetical protein